VTNNYGDFRIDNLAPNSGEYILEVEYPNYPKKEIRVELKDSINLGVFLL
jgi:hypothetical protein